MGENSLKRRAGGCSLIEVMVSICVLAVGVIGAAGMQLAALRTMQQTASRVAARQLAADMAEEIGASAGRKEAALYAELDYRALREVEPGVPSTLCYYSRCGTADFAALEIYEWKSRIRSVLPGGRVRICRDAAWAGSGRKPSWDCGGGNSDLLVIKLGWQLKSPGGRLEQDAAGSPAPGVVLAVSAG